MDTLRLKNYRCFEDTGVIDIKPITFLFCLSYEASGILVPQPGIKPVPTALEARNLNHWTTRKSLNSLLCPQNSPHPHCEP